MQEAARSFPQAVFSRGLGIKVPARCELNNSQYQLRTLFATSTLGLPSQVFDDRFSDPRHTSEERFLWDYFHIPNQYTMHRTQVRRSRGMHLLVLLTQIPSREPYLAAAEAATHGCCSCCCRHQLPAEVPRVVQPRQ